MYGLVDMMYINLSVPSAPAGRLFATLPINLSLPFSISIQADWLLDLARQGLRDIATNQWQRSLVTQTANVLAKYLTFISTLSGPNLRDRVSRGFGLLSALGTEAPDPLHLTSSDWRVTVKDLLRPLAVFPVISNSNGSEDVVYKKASEVYVLPSFTKKLPADSHLLFGRYIVDRSVFVFLFLLSFPIPANE